MSKPLLGEGKAPKELKGHDLLSLAHKLIRECEPGTLYVDGYTARMIRNVRVTESPEWLKTKLEAVGLRPINNVVDITNYVLLEVGQPLHAFDKAKLDGGIHVRAAGEGEGREDEGEERKAFVGGHRADKLARLRGRLSSSRRLWSAPWAG